MKNVKIFALCEMKWKQEIRADRIKYALNRDFNAVYRHCEFRQLFGAPDRDSISLKRRSGSARLCTYVWRNGSQIILLPRINNGEG